MFCGRLRQVAPDSHLLLDLALDLGLGNGSERSRADRLAAAIDRRIHSDAMPPGSSVGTLEGLRAESGLARATVSEAARLLRDRGIVEIRPGRGGGLFVADPSPVVRLRHTLLAVTEDPSAVREAIELREHLEPLVDLGAARCRTDQDVAELRGLLAQMERASDWEAFMQSNWALHERIARICPNAMARGVYTGTLGHLSSASARLAQDGDATAAYRVQRHAVHAALVEAIAQGDDAAVHDAVARHNASPESGPPAGGVTTSADRDQPGASR